MKGLIEWFSGLIISGLTIFFTVTKTAKIIKEKKSLAEIDEEVQKFIKKADSNGIEIIGLKGANKAFSERLLRLEKEFEKHEAETKERFEKLEKRIDLNHREIGQELKEIRGIIDKKFDEILQELKKAN